MTFPQPSHRIPARVRRSSWLHGVSLGLMLLGALACGRTRPPAPFEPALTGPYQLHPGDVLDVKFLYHPSETQRLTIRPDGTLPLTITGDLDVNGWDVGKALKLLMKGNAVIIEWLTSPVVHGADEWFRDEFLALAGRLARRELIARHYLHLGERQRRTYFGSGREVPLKKVSLPPYEEGCDADPEKVACDYPPYPLNKIVATTFVENGGPGYELVKNFQWTNEDQNLVAKYIAEDGMSPEDAADKWIADNQDKVDTWLEGIA